nr:hypothetical protein [Tanacetum cinerariifolium]
MLVYSHNVKTRNISRVLCVILVILPEHQSDTKVLTMTMEILPEPKSNNLHEKVEGLDTLEVPAVKNSLYKGLNRRSNSCSDGASVIAGGETFGTSFELEGAAKHVKVFESRFSVISDVIWCLFMSRDDERSILEGKEIYLLLIEGQEDVSNKLIEILAGCFLSESWLCGINRGRKACEPVKRNSLEKTPRDIKKMINVFESSISHATSLSLLVNLTTPLGGSLVMLDISTKGFPSTTCVTKLTTGRLVNASSCDVIDMVIKDLDIEPKDIIAEFCCPFQWKELSKESGSKILLCGDGSCWKTFKPIASLIAKEKIK